MDVDDNSMVGPGMHEQAAQNLVGENDAAASVEALLAIASAINWFAEAIENYTASQV
jgi:hypothetical protein